MVCTKCQKLQSTKLATPEVKKKSDMYYGSPTASSSSSSLSKVGGEKRSATLGQTGVGKSKLLSKAAKNPYAQYSSTCTKCKTKVSQGFTFCQRCAYTSNSCASCGKANKKSSSTAPVVSGQKFTMK